MKDGCIKNNVIIYHSSQEMMDRLKSGLKIGYFLDEFMPTPPHQISQWRKENWGVEWEYFEPNQFSEKDGIILFEFFTPYFYPKKGYQKLKELGFKIDAEFCDYKKTFCGMWKDGQEILDGLKNK